MVWFWFSLCLQVGKQTNECDIMIWHWSANITCWPKLYQVALFRKHQILARLQETFLLTQKYYLPLISPKHQEENMLAENQWSFYTNAVKTLIKLLLFYVQPLKSCFQSSRRSDIVQACSRPSWFANWRDETVFATSCRRTTTLSQHAFRLFHKSDVRIYWFFFYFYVLILNKAGLNKK